MSKTNNTETDNTNFMHLKVGEGRVTAAFDVVKESDKGPESMRLGLSLCSPNDQFCRKKGRQIASSRIKGGGKYSYKLPVNSKENLGNQLRDFISKYFVKGNSNLPGWVSR